MRDEENAKPDNVDPRCIKEALRMCLQLIKNDDPQLDFYTMYERETVEHDTEYMQKYNEDLNTTLIFLRIRYRRSIKPERSEADLRAIVLSLNQPISPDGDPATPPAQLEVVKKFLDAYMSLNMKKAKPVLSNNLQFESLPVYTDLPKQTKESYLRMWGSGSKAGVVSDIGNRLQAQTDRAMSKTPRRSFTE